LNETVFSTACEMIGKQGRKHQDRFNEHFELLQQLTRQTFV